jgi:predicted nucleic acid-binding protein
VSLYIDTSVLLKLFFSEPESVRTSEIVSHEPDITVSSLTRLEALIHIQRREAIGMLTSAKAGRRRRRLERLVTLSPFKLQTCPSALITAAERQVQSVTTYCPTLDRLHLAAMQLFHLRRLLTNDDSQAKAAHELGFEVILPR